MISSILMRIARAILQNVLQQLNQLQQQIEEQAMNVVKAIVGQVVGGVWRGNAANAFVEECTSLVMPKIGASQGSVRTFGEGLNKAREIMDNAEQQAENMIKNLAPSLKFL